MSDRSGMEESDTEDARLLNPAIDPPSTMMTHSINSSIDPPSFTTTHSIHDDDDAPLISADGETTEERVTTPEVQAFAKPQRTIIIEPVLALFFIAFIPGVTLSQQFVYMVLADDKNLTSYAEYIYGNGSVGAITCLNAYKNDTYYWIQQETQSEAAVFTLYLELASALISLPMVFVYGSISDLFGRKPMMIMPLIGGILRYTIYIVTMTQYYSIYLLLLGNAVESLFGGATAIITSCFSYIADITDHSKRSMKITINEVIFSFANAVGQIALGFLIKSVGFLYPVYGLLSFHVINLLYVIFFVPESRPYTGRVDNLLMRIMAHTKGCFRVYTEADQFGQRWILPLCVPCFFFCSMVFTARWAPSILYMLNSPLCWSSVEIGVWSGVLAVTTNIGSIVLVMLFFKRVGDAGLAIISCLSGVVSFVVISFAVSDWIMFLSPIVGFASFLAIPMLRSIASKRASSEKQGALFASIAAIEALCNLAGSGVFNPIYQATLNVWKGFVFIVLAIVQLAGLVCIWILRRKLNKTRPTSPVVITDKDVTA